MFDKVCDTLLGSIWQAWYDQTNASSNKVPICSNVHTEDLNTVEGSMTFLQTLELVDYVYKSVV